MDVRHCVREANCCCDWIASAFLATATALGLKILHQHRSNNWEFRNFVLCHCDILCDI